MKKLVAILLLSFTLPLCAMEETAVAAEEYRSEGGSGSGGQEDWTSVTGVGTPLSPVRRTSP